MEQSTGRSVTGIYEPEPSIARKVPAEHGFGLAIADALDKIAPEWGPGEYDVSVTLEARVSAENPGQIDGYKAILSD